MTSERATTLKIEISTKTLFSIVGIILGLALLYTLRSIVAIFLISFIFAAALLGPVHQLIKLKVPKGLAVILVYLVITIITIVSLSIIAVPVAKETTRLLEHIPTIYEKIVDAVNALGRTVGLDFSFDSTTLTTRMNELVERYIRNLDSIVSTGTQGVSGIIDMLSGVFGGIFSIFSILGLSAFIIYDHDNTVRTILRQIPVLSLRKRVQNFIIAIELHLGRWLGGQMLIALFDGLLSWAFLSVLGVQYALPLAIFVVLMTPIPFFGATLSVVPAFIVALSSGSLVQIIGVPTAYLVIQQIENNIVGPKIMSNAIGLPPFIILLAIMAGGQLYGLPGIILAVPIAGVAHLALQFLTDHPQETDLN